MIFFPKIVYDLGSRSWKSYLSIPGQANDVTKGLKETRETICTQKVSRLFYGIQFRFINPLSAIRITNSRCFMQPQSRDVDGGSLGKGWQKERIVGRYDLFSLGLLS